MRSLPLLRGRLFALPLIVLAACTEPEGEPHELEPEGPIVGFRVRGLSEIAFGDVPFPSDLMRAEDGTLRIYDFPNPLGSTSLDQYLRVAASKVNGFGLQSAAYFTFDRPLDPAGIPTPPASVAAGSSIAFVNVTPDSPHFGERTPVDAKYLDGTHWLPPHSLAVLPHSGFPLREKSTYAVVLTDGLRGVDGRPITAAPELVALRDLDAAANDDEQTALARSIYRPAVDALVELGVPRASIRALAVFTTQGIVSEMVALRDAALALPAPTLALDGKQSTPSNCGTQFGATFSAPVWQEGTPPFRTLGSGAILFDAEGRPKRQGMVDVGIWMIVPSGTMPAAGWPVVVYGHGSSGNRRSVNHLGPCEAVRAGFVLVGMDFPLHGDRPGTVVGQEELNLINPGNPTAGRNFARQGASDLVVLARVLKRPDLALPGGARLDTRRMLYLSQSMGGFIGPLALAVSGDFVAAAMNGAGGGNFLYYLPRTPYTEEVGELLTFALSGIGMTREETDRYHPFLNLGQALTDASDSVPFARHLALEPLAGNAPKHLFFMAGDEDQYVAPASTEALAVAAGAGFADVPEGWLPPSVALFGGVRLSVPLAPNLTVGGQPVLAAVHQYRFDHFALDCKAGTRKQMVAFLQSALAGSPTVPALDRQLPANDCWWK